MKKTITVTVNGEQHTDEVESRLLLVHYLRDVLSLTGTHVGCETSLCGACTVVLNGQAVKSCTVLAVQADGGEVLTIEGLEKDGKMSQDDHRGQSDKVQELTDKLIKEVDSTLATKEAEIQKV